MEENVCTNYKQELTIISETIYCRHNGLTIHNYTIIVSIYNQSIMDIAYSTINLLCKLEVH